MTPASSVAASRAVLTLDVHWNDDFHHALHHLLTGEADGYYQDFGSVGHLAKAFTDGFVYTGEYSPYRERCRGSACRDIPGSRFLVFAQNHDQVGNRLHGERLSALVSFDALKLAAAVVLLSPNIPLLFMGEEYGETAHFVYFVSHTDEALREAVCHGRQREFEAANYTGEAQHPCEEDTFLKAKLNHHLRRDGHHKTLWEFYRELIGLRKELNSAVDLGRREREVRDYEKEKVLWVRMMWESTQALALFSFSKEAQTLSFPRPGGAWGKRLDSADARWGGPGAPAPAEVQGEGEISLTLQPLSAVVYLQQE